ncbi:MAG: hypothetical protein J0L82_13785 [Deltaproteobacteria bacterium]|nr:hypothetical protein [Deltaproteobacteria bacterium]
MRLGLTKVSKSTAAFVAAAMFSTAAVAAVFTIQEVNQKVSALTAPFNNANTVMNFEFTSLAVDAVRATDFGVKGFYKKTEGDNEVVLDLKSAQYTYGDGKNPTANLDLGLKFDVVKAVGQEVINEIAKEIDKLALELASEQAAEYGAAAKIDAKVTENKVDANGDVESIKMTLSASLDLAQLPASKPVNEEEFKSIELSVSAGRTGFEVKASVVMNPEYRRFNTGDDGLKEYVEKLLADDVDTYQELSQFLAILDSGASWLLNLNVK